MKERVVVTGMGVITPVGNNVDDFWNSVKAGKTGFGKIPHLMLQILRHRWRQR